MSSWDSSYFTFLIKSVEAAAPFNVVSHYKIPHITLAELHKYLELGRQCQSFSKFIMCPVAGSVLYSTRYLGRCAVEVLKL